MLGQISKEVVKYNQYRGRNKDFLHYRPKLCAKRGGETEVLPEWMFGDGGPYESFRVMALRWFKTTQN